MKVVKFGIFQLVSLCLLLGVHDIKTLLLAVTVYFCGIFFLFRFSLFETLFFTVVFVLPIEKGLRGASVQVVAPGTEVWMSAYTFYFGITLKLLITLALGLLLFKEKSSFKKNNIFWLVTLFLLASAVSTAFASDFLLAFVGFLRIAQAVVLFFSAVVFFNKEKSNYFFWILLGCLALFHSSIGIWQYGLQGAVGFYLEDAFGIRSSGFFTYDGSNLFRATGLLGHPTFFASFLSMLFACVGGLFTFEIVQPKKRYGLLFASGFALVTTGLAILLSFSRSAWVLLGLLIPLFIWVAQHWLQKKILVVSLALIGLLFLIAVLAIEPLQARLTTISEVFSQGSGVVRVLLVQQAIHMVKEAPIWGVGLNHFTRSMVRFQLVPELRGFMYPVHNTFLLFYAELGVLATSVFIGILVLMLARTLWWLRQWLASKKIAILVVGACAAVVSFIANAQFHTLFNQDPSFDLLWIMLGYLVALCQHHSQLPSLPKDARNN